MTTDTAKNQKAVQKILEMAEDLERAISKLPRELRNEIEDLITDWNDGTMAPTKAIRISCADWLEGGRL